MEVRIRWGTIKNTCECGELTAVDTEHECWGDEWESMVETFTFSTEHWFADCNRWQVERLSLGNSENWEFSAYTPAEMLSAITYSRSWTLHYRLVDDALEFSLSNPGLPSFGTVRPVRD